MPETIPQDVIRLVVAARRVAFEDASPGAIKELDAASEAFANRVPWEDEPDPSGNEQPTCWHDGCGNPAVVLRASGNWCGEHETSPQTAAEMAPEKGSES